MLLRAVSLLKKCLEIKALVVVLEQEKIGAFLEIN